MRIRDAVMLSVAADAGCRLVLSEDLQDGFTWRGVTVTNPFGGEQHALLDSLLRRGRGEP
jgi:predicted nucleic acid-binding protein